jgi:hypothetical protein
MERKSGKAMKITFGLVGAGLLTAGMLSSATGAQGGGRATMTVNAATRALVYGGADATWTDRAAALIAQNGEAARALGRVAEAENVDGVARARALEALGRAGSVDAQEAMRHALSSPTVRGDAAYPMLVARLSALPTPTFDTLMYLAQLRSTALDAGQLELAEAASPVCHRLHQARGGASPSHKR